MEDFTKIEITPKEGVNERQPRGISVTKVKAGNYYDAMNSQENYPNHHLPSIEELHIIGRYAPSMLPMEMSLFSSNQMENFRIKGLFFTHPQKDRYESEELELERARSHYFIFVRIEY